MPRRTSRCRQSRCCHARRSNCWPSGFAKARLIRASHPNHARRHVERTAVAGLDIRIATQDDLERAIVDQTPVEESQAQKEIL